MRKNLEKDKRFLELRELLDSLKKDYGVSEDAILREATDLKVPISLFSSGLSGLEIICKYLSENKDLSLKSITELTGRSKQGVWQAINKANQKHPKRFSYTESRYDIPVSIITKDRPILVSIVSFLREEFELSYAKIARLLHRDQRTVWTVYNRK